MPEQKVILIGAGGHAASVSDSAKMAGIHIAGYVDEVKSADILEERFSRESKIFQTIGITSTTLQ